MILIKNLIKSSNKSNIVSHYLIVGLGNPGKEYQNTRHNIGYMVADRYCQHIGNEFTQIKYNSYFASKKLVDMRITIAKPLTFMNRSGQAVASLVRFHKIEQSNILIIHDDIDLPFETIRIRPQGGTGGHKGIISIVEKLGTDQFARMRLGIGRPPGRMEASNYVLKSFSKKEIEIISIFTSRAVDAIDSFIIDGIEVAMNKFNGPTAGD